MDKLKEILTFLQSVEIGQIIDIIIAIAVIILFLVISPMLSYLLLRIFYKKENKEEIKKASLYKSMRVFLNLLGVFFATKILKLTIQQDAFIDKCFRIVIIWAIANIISGALELREIIIEKINNSSIRANISKKDSFLVTIISKIVKLILYIIAAYLTLKEFGYDLGGLATGLGITGAVVALAAQDMVKQLFAGLSIYMDKPFEIGDWVEMGDVAGTVESIAIRSTKIRTIEDTIVTVENNTILTSNVINWGKINKRVYKSNLKLALETEEATVEKVLNRIRFILRYNKDIIKNSISVQFNKIEKDGINISIYVETTITQYIEYQKFCNQLNLTLLNILETQNVKLAYPGQNIYIKENVLSSSKLEEKKIAKPTKRIHN